MKLAEILEGFDNDQDTFIKAVDAELLKLMDENPDFVYPNSNTGPGRTCFYDRGPSGDAEKCAGCIFGQALQRLGWSNKAEMQEGKSIVAMSVNYCPGVCAPMYWPRIQGLQDGGDAWGTLRRFIP